MCRFTILTCLIACLAPMSRASDALKAVTVSFYSEQITLAYNPEFVPAGNFRIEEREMVAFYQQLLRRDYAPLLDNLRETRLNYGLNDWLYYDLLRRSVSQIWSGLPAAKRELISWFLLSESGYDTRITFRQGEVFLYVFTQDEVFEVPMIEEAGRVFVNLTSIHRESKKQEALYLLNFAPRPQGRPFSFYLPELPRLQPVLRRRHFEFPYGDYTYRLDVNTDQTVVEVMKRYPFIAEQQYLEVPLSASIARSLLPQLRQMIRGKTNREALEFLVAFTRSSFKYKDDKEYFGRSKPMIADEVFHYPFSDCEDRSALFYRLVRELLDLPMIIIAFPDHLTIGVALDEPCGQAIPYQGRLYYICDPTGPVNSATIGRFPQGYEKQAYKIIGRYR